MTHIPSGILEKPRNQLVGEWILFVTLLQTVFNVPVRVGTSYELFYGRTITGTNIAVHKAMRKTTWQRPSHRTPQVVEFCCTPLDFQK